MTRSATFALSVTLLAALASCSSPAGPTPGPCTVNCDPPPAITTNVLVGAGDIAVCGLPGALATGDLIDNIDGTVFTTGDNAYPSGSARDYADCYQPFWGRHRPRTRPTPGNHEYETPGAAGYFSYFGDAAGRPGEGYYAYRVGDWKVVALNSEIAVGPGSPQYAWLRNELTTQGAACTAAIWHRPLFSSGQNGPQPQMRDLYKLLYDNNAEIVLNGHDHLYERFAPQDPDGRRDDARGLRQFTIGTGGAPLYDFVGVRPNSERQRKAYGVLRLALSTGRYQWDFIEVTGAFGDSGAGTCH